MDGSNPNHEWFCKACRVMAADGHECGPTHHNPHIDQNPYRNLSERELTLRLLSPPLSDPKQERPSASTGHPNAREGRSQEVSGAGGDARSR